MNKMMKVFRISTVPISLNILLKGQLKWLNQFYDVTAVSGPGKHLDEVAEREGVKVHPIEMQRHISLWKDIVSLVRLYRYFKREKPHIVHSITPKAGLLSMLAAKMAGVPIRIHTFTGLVFPSKHGPLKALLIVMDRLICTAATHIYPEGNGVREDLLRYRITDKPLRIIANGNINGTDLAHFCPSQISSFEKQKLRSQLGFSEFDFVFVFVGRLVRDKGITELVRAFASLTRSLQTPQNETSGQNLIPKLPQTVSDLKAHESVTTKIKLLLVGPKEEKLNAFPAEVSLEIENNPDIVAVGFQRDVRPYFAISHTHVLPSYREGFPNAVLQAGAMGLPAIVSDINGCNEIIIQGTNGSIVPAKNAEALEEAMDRVVRDKEWRSHLEGNARAVIASRYGQDLVWNGLRQEYQKIISDFLSNN